MSTPQNALFRPPAAIAALALLAAVYEWALFATTFSHPGLIGPNYNTPGTDWMVFYSAAQSFWHGQLDLLADGDRFTAFLNAQFSGVLTQPLSYRPWIAPPSFLLLLLPFGLVGFGVSYAAFQLAGAALLLASLRLGASDPKSAWTIGLPALFCPAAALNAVDGQTGFLVTALLIGGLRSLDKKPVLAGILFGLLSVKPQYFVLVPVALVAARQWRALFWTFASALALTAASAALFGFEPWLLWFHKVLAGDPKWIEHGRLWGNSIYASAVLLGAPGGLASALQAAGLLGGAAAVYAGFRRIRESDLKCALLLAIVFLAAPHSGPYEAMMPVVAGCLWLKHATAPAELWRWTIVLAVWLVPLVSPPAVSPPGRFVPLLLIALAALILREASTKERVGGAISG
ncbi:MAG: DUF2029 domain-containing protein [Alphaproteobacteria bacterium]|nr:DUF2029 domain-containing protein [Alphaproteobacteria bacterium]MDE2629649.1 DUF2029 domain-containing protein [Alphaproteobacteria bacterium]